MSASVPLVHLSLAIPPPFTISRSNRFHLKSHPTRQRFPKVDSEKSLGFLPQSV